jgi:hypothetical protein
VHGFEVTPLGGRVGLVQVRLHGRSGRKDAQVCAQHTACIMAPSPASASSPTCPLTAPLSPAVGGGHRAAV